MAKKTAYMTKFEKTAGAVFFVIYLLVLPLLADRLLSLVEILLDTDISDSLTNALYYYALFAVTVLIFHGFLSRTSARFLSNISRSFLTLLIGLLAFYGANTEINNPGASFDIELFVFGFSCCDNRRRYYRIV